MDVIEDELFPNKNLENKESVVVLKKFKMLAVDKMIGYGDFIADGAIGFGLDEDSEDNYQIEEGTSFTSMIFETQDREDIPDNVFG